MKQKIQITESQLHSLIKEGVLKAMNEIGDTKKGQYKLGRLAARKYFDLPSDEKYRLGDKTSKVDIDTYAEKSVNDYAKAERDTAGKKQLSRDERRPVGVLKSYMKGVRSEFNKSKHKDEKTVSEEQLRKLIRESVIKSINEISTDMMRNARDKFGDTYGPKWVDDTSNPMGPKDHPFYPLKMHYKPTKDGKDFSVHMNNFNDAITKSEMEEIKNLGDEELAKRAEQIWNRYSNDADFEEYDRDGGEVWGSVILEVDGWEFSTDGSGFGHRDYNLDWEITGDSVEFTAPDGRSGSFSI